MDAPRMDREIITHAADHEIILSFNGDSDAEYFTYWWSERGLKQFQKWADKEIEKDARSTDPLGADRKDPC